MSRIFSVGYADHTPETLVALLKQAGVAAVVDVRANPISRKKGFSKRQLTEAFGLAGIEYLSVRELGIPTADRKAAAGGASGWGSLLADYAASLDVESHRGAAASALSEACLQAATAVMCLESDLDHCHRKPLTEWIAARTRLELAHL